MAAKNTDGYNINNALVCVDAADGVNNNNALVFVDPGNCLENVLIFEDGVIIDVDFSTISLTGDGCVPASSL